MEAPYLSTSSVVVQEVPDLFSVFQEKNQNHFLEHCKYVYDLSRRRNTNIYIWQLTMLNIITMIIWHYKKTEKLGVLK